MSNSESDSSEFWNLYRKRHDTISETSESSEFWNLYRKNYKEYSLSEEFSSDDEDEEEENETKKKTSKQKKPDKIVAPNKNNLTKQEETDLVAVKIKTNESENNPTQSLPPKEFINNGKKIYEYTIIEFYNSFMKNIIEIVKSLKQGKGINTLFNDKERLLHLGIGLIIISVILVPITLN